MIRFRHVALCLIACALASVSLHAPAAARDATDPDMQRIANFRLTEPVVDKYIQVQTALMQAVKAHPELQQQAMAQGNAKSLDEAIARVERQPVIHAILARNGMSASDYVLCTFALLQGGIYAASVKLKGDKAWTQIPPGIPTENTRYVLAHKPQMDKLRAAGGG